MSYLNTEISYFIKSQKVMYSLSYYTHLFSKGNKYYVYNSQTNFFSEISESFFYCLKESNFEIPYEVLAVLLKNHIIEEKSNLDSYWKEELYRHQIANFNPTQLNLVIAPTTNCNFKCPYCFEESKPNLTMTDETISALISFINRWDHIKKLNLTWYGGEPLLAIKEIKKFYRLLQSETSITIDSQHIITNGYSINKAVCEFFSEIGLKKIQITLDGLKEENDKSRILLGGGGTFDVIISNLKLLIKYIQDIEISIRVNIHKENIQNFYDVVEYFKFEFPDYQFNVYPGIIRSDNRELGRICFASDEIYSLRKELKNNGIKIDLSPSKLEKGCMMHNSMSFLIGPDGSIYKCWNDIGKSNKCIGNVKHSESFNKNLYLKYFYSHPLYSSECRRCKVLPLCDGGCGLYRYNNDYENGCYKVCSSLRDPRLLEDAVFNLPKI